MAAMKTVIPIVPACPGGSRDAVCVACSLGTLCLAPGMVAATTDLPDPLGATRLTVARGESLFSAGDPFTAVYAVRSGFLKTRLVLGWQREAVFSWHMAGDLIGLEGIAEGQHRCDAVALEDSRICALPYRRLEQALHDFSELQRAFLKLMSRQIGSGHSVMMWLAGMRAEERVAAFVLDLAQRMKARGYSSSSLVLRMSRAEIGTYLGLKLETVSRCFSKLHENQVLFVRHKDIRILDRVALERLAQGSKLRLD